MEMNFDWDETKNRTNLAKHGIDFRFAIRVFADSQRIEKYDFNHNEDEDRWIVIGMSAPAILVVIYTERQGGEVIRLVSARQANEREQKEYYNGHD
jgi:uncharacterized DUF497 family protein